MKSELTGSIIQAIASIVAAIIGAWLTYYFATKAETKIDRNDTNLHKQGDIADGYLKPNAIIIIAACFVAIIVGISAFHISRLLSIYNNNQESMHNNSSTNTVAEVVDGSDVVVESKNLQLNEKPKYKYLLSVCPPYQTAGYYVEQSYSIMGTTYINGFHLNDNNGGIAYFNLGGRFDTLSFDVGHIDNKRLETGYYYIYVDGELTQALTLNPSMLVEHMEIQLNGAKQLIIQGGNWCHCYALVNVMVSVNDNDGQDVETSKQTDEGEYLLNVCPPYQVEGYYTEKSYSLAGNNYINGFHLNDNNGGIAYFNLGGRFDTLSFDVGHIDNKRLETGYYYFYADGVLTQALTLNPSMLVEHMEIQLNGAQQLIIQGGNWCHCYALVNVMVSGNDHDGQDVETSKQTDEGEYLLSVCPPYQVEGYYTEKSYSLAGNNYINGFHLNDNNGGIAYFNLGGRYDTLSFDVGHIDGKKLEIGYYYIYLDGKLTNTLKLDPSMLVQRIVIPLNGAKQMVIEGGNWCHCFALVNIAVQ